jgi:hypothetical protein
MWISKKEFAVMIFSNIWTIPTDCRSLALLSAHSRWVSSGRKGHVSCGLKYGDSGHGNINDSSLR